MGSRRPVPRASPMRGCQAPFELLKSSVIRFDLHDRYHLLVAASWPVFALTAFAFVMVLNVIFALGPGAPFRTWLPANQAARRFFDDAPALDLRVGFFSTTSPAVTRPMLVRDTARTSRWAPSQNASAFPSGQPASIHM
jgi:hypothetical protein